MNTIKLFRPVGMKEMELIAESNYKTFPPRLAWQPIFYPVTNQQYAEQIAFDWNTNDEFSGFIGLVTAFDVNEEYLNKYEIQNVGGKIHNELWIPSEDLDEFNANIIGLIELVKVFSNSKSVSTENNELNNYIKSMGHDNRIN